MLTEETRCYLFYKYGENNYNIVMRFVEFLHNMGRDVDIDVREDYFDYFVRNYILPNQELIQDFNAIYMAYITNILTYKLGEDIKYEKPKFCKL